MDNDTFKMVVIYPLFAPLMILLIQSQIVESVNYNHSDCRYHFHVQNLTWMEAYNVCKNKNMSLLQLNEQDEMTTIQSLLQSKVNHLITNLHNQIGFAWIGLHATSQHSTSQSNIYYFWPGCEQPTSTGHLPDSWLGHSEMCGVFNASLTNYDLVDCLKELPFVCEERMSDSVPCFSEETLAATKSLFHAAKTISNDVACAENCFSMQSCAAYMMTTSTSCVIYVRSTTTGISRNNYYIKNIVDWSSYTSIASTIPPEDVCSIKPSITDPLTSTDLVTSSASFIPQTTSLSSLHPSTFSYDSSDTSSLTSSLPTISYKTSSSSLTSDIVDWYSYTSITSTILLEDVCSMTSSLTVPLTSTDLVTSSASFKPQTTSLFSLHPSTFSYDTSDSSSLVTPSLPTTSYKTLSSSLTSVLPSISPCYCPCHMVSNVTYTPEELQQKIEEIKSELTIPTKKTNKYKRSLISAPDDRPSARGLGSLGIIVIVIIVTMLVAFDFPRVARSVLKITRKGKKKLCKQSAT